jgi:dCMP deaminase
MRQGWDDYFMTLAFMAASRGTCPRRQVGAVLVQNKCVRGTGYNGSPAGTDSCLEDGCLMRDGSCVRTIHAEANLMLQTDATERTEAAVYCTDRPCFSCANLLANAGIREIVYCRGYHRDEDLVLSLMEKKNIIFRQLESPDGIDMVEPII